MGNTVSKSSNHRLASHPPGEERATVFSSRCYRLIFSWVIFLAIFGVENSLLAFKGTDRCAQIIYIEGQVLLKDRSSELQAATMGKRLRSGESIQTLSQGKVALTFSDDSIIRLGENSEMLIKMKRTPQNDPPYRIRAILTKGMAWMNLSRRTPGNENLDTVTRYGLMTSSNGIFRIKHFPDQSQSIKFYKGTGTISGPIDDYPIRTDAKGEELVSVEGAPSISPWRFGLKAYEQVIIKQTGIATKPFRFAAKADQTVWVRWNQQQDKEGLVASSP